MTFGDYMQMLFIAVGSFLIGNEYGASLGWGIWLIAMAHGS